jgi:aspartate racemase
LRAAGRRAYFPRQELESMKTIGILGGLGPESTIAYYACITRTYYERRGDLAYPEVLIHSLSFKDFIDIGYEKVGRIKAAIEGLAAAGADFVVAACNSIHVVHEQVAGDIPIPWVSIMDATGEAVRSRGLSKVLLLGTVFTMGGDFYSRGLAKFGIETVVPGEADQKKINEIIYGELVRAVVTEPSREHVLGVIDRMRDSGIEGVVLGCTELPFLITQEHTDLPVFDTTTIHAHKALDLAMEAEC